MALHVFALFLLEHGWAGFDIFSFVEQLLLACPVSIEIPLFLSEGVLLTFYKFIQFYAE